jgi:hypothetical protein
VLGKLFLDKELNGGIKFTKHKLTGAKMNKEFPFVEIPANLLERVGRPDPETRLFRAYGSEADIGKWYEAVWEICRGEGSISPGGVSGYVKVSRPAVHKRLKEGRLTGFFFHLIVEPRFFKGRKKLEEGGRPYIEIPVVEAKAWAEELASRKGLLEEEQSIPPTSQKYDGVLRSPRNRGKSASQE